MRGVRAIAPLWTDEQLEVIRGYVTAGTSIPTACDAAGVPWSTARHWLDKGKRGIEPYDRFAEAMKRAQAMHEAAATMVITRAADKGDWRAAAYLLERRSAQTQAARSTEGEGTIVMYPVRVHETAQGVSLQCLPVNQVPGFADAFDTLDAEEEEP